MSNALRTSMLAAYLTGHPWMLHRPVLSALVAIVDRHDRGIRLDGAEIDAVVHGRDERRAPMKAAYDGLGCAESFDGGGTPYVLSGSVAIVPVHGMITKYAGMVNGASQPAGMSCDRIVQALAMAHADNRVRRVIMDIDSPGGTVAGGEDLVVGMRKVRSDSKKEMVAFIHDQGCSGGYLAAAQCDAVYCTRNAIVGSLGVYCVVEDSSKALEKVGVYRRVVSSGEFKGAFEPGTPVSEGQIAELQNNVTTLADWYVQRTLIEGRKMSAEAAAKLADGRTWVGPDAVAIGLCDGVTTLAELAAAMNKVN